MSNSVMKALLVALLFGASFLPGLCFAQVQLPTVNLGLANFEDGFASPGWFLQEFPDYYDADRLKDARGATVPGSNHLMTFATTTHVDFANGPSTTIHGLADLTVGAGLQWEPTRIGSGIFAHRLLLDVTVPTGQYSDQQPVNLSNHYVVVEPYHDLAAFKSHTEFTAVIADNSDAIARLLLDICPCA